MPSPLRVVGYAIVSTEGMIADAAGHIPPALINAADQTFFSDGLDAADVVVHGRNSQDQHPNSPRRRRLILTRQIAALAPQPDNPKALLWNPAGAAFEDACAGLGVDRGIVAIVGGSEVFGLFLPRYDTFYLTTAAHARIPGGRPVFPGIPPHTPEELLQTEGLRASATSVLDPEAAVSVRTWQR
jgi:dihydrofolate reductase